MKNYKAFLTQCCECGRPTSKAYAAKHNGQCKACAEPEKQVSREALIIDSGWQAYAREEGHYDHGDY